MCDARRRHTIEDIVVLFQATRANAKGRRQLFTVGLRRSTYLSGVAASQKVTFSALWWAYRELLMTFGCMRSVTYDSEYRSRAGRSS